MHNKHDRTPVGGKDNFERGVHKQPEGQGHKGNGGFEIGSHGFS